MADNRERKISKIIGDYGGRLMGFIKKRVSSNEEAEDILQEVWFQLSRIVDLDSIEQLSGWLFRVARNRVTDNYRKQKPLPFSGLAPSSENESHFLEILTASTQNEDEIELKQLFWEALFTALDELPIDQKNVFVWNEIDGETLQQISDRTDVNIKTLISRKRYAVQHLRKRLQKLYDEFIAH